MNKASRKTTNRRGRHKAVPALGGVGLALYKRIMLEVTRMLSNGALGAGEPLPTEKQLAARYGVSIGTIRRATDDLVAEHVIVRQQGLGTFLATFSPERMLNRFWPVFRKEEGREIPIVQTLSFLAERADAGTARALALAKGDPTYHIVNLMLMGGNSILVDDVRLPKVLYPGLTEQNFVSREMTMYGLYQSRYGVNLVRTVDRLHGVAADPQTARRFGVAVATPLLAFIRIAYTFDDKPVELRRTLLYTEAYEYRNAIGGEH